MNKKETVTGRFNDDEYVWIKRFMKLNKIKNDNQLVRAAIDKLMDVSFADGIKNPPKLPPEYVTAYNFFEKLRKEFSENLRTKLRIEKIFNDWKSEFFKNHTPVENEKYFISNLMLKAFQDDHKPRGRPKQPRKKRGRPKK